MTGRIVVGVDGSSGAHLAMAWAAEEAARRGDALVLVHAWQYVFAGDLVVTASAALEEAAKQVLEEAKQEAAGLGATVAETRLQCGGAAEALLDAAAEEGTELLVVGSRGRGGFGALLLGSTSQQCVHHAPCPVVVVPATWKPAS
jgi:nucleotide-binding universal stress UspA family protein